jgi:hypothetical protein
MSDRIKVAIKVRPLIEREELEDRCSLWEVRNDSIFLKDNGGKYKEYFTFGKLLFKWRTLQLFVESTQIISEQFLSEPLVIDYLNKHKT